MVPHSNKKNIWNKINSVALKRADATCLLDIDGNYVIVSLKRYCIYLPTLRIYYLLRLR